MPASSATQASLGQLMQWCLYKDNDLESTWTFLIPPESFEQSEAVRANIQRTVSGGYADLFGLDLPTIVIEGTTGYSVRQVVNGVTVDGYQHWLNFLTMYRDFANSPLVYPGSSYRMHFYDWTHRQYWSIMPTNCTWDMATPENTVFYYQLEATALEPLSNPGSAPPGASYDSLVTSSTTSYVAAATSGATSGAMVTQLMTIQAAKGAQAL